MELKDKLLDVLGLPEKQTMYDETCMVRKIDRGFVIKYGRMYDSPGLSFAILKSLGELFGTDKIDVDDFANGGCDTCDWGSCYGHEIQVYEPTENVAAIAELVGKELMLLP